MNPSQTTERIFASIPFHPIPSHFDVFIYVDGIEPTGWWFQALKTSFLKSQNPLFSIRAFYRTVLPAHLEIAHPAHISDFYRMEVVYPYRHAILDM